MRKSLQVSPTPFKPSFLSIPPSPFSPRTPFTPTAPSQHTAWKKCQQISTISKPAIHAPPSPLRWTWRCHKCHRSYGLSVTRRCLEDGHYYCNGPTKIKEWRKPKNARRTRKPVACSSEFDYSGWKDWSRWRRGGPRDKAALPSGSPVINEGEAFEHKKKDCWNMCDYPSECKWGKRFGIHTPIQTRFPVVEVDTMSALDSPASTTSEGILRPENYRDIKTSDNGSDPNFWAALLASAERRKHASTRASSPLSAVTESHAVPERDGSATTLPEQDQGNVTITITEPYVSSDSDVSSLSDSSDSSTVEGSSKLLLSRRRYRRGRSSPKTQNSGNVQYAESGFASQPNQQANFNNSGALGNGLESFRRVQSTHNGYLTCLG